MWDRANKPDDGLASCCYNSSPFTSANPSSTNVSEPEQQSRRLSTTSQDNISRKAPAKSLKKQSTKAKQAIELLNQGKLQEAEAIYEELISSGTKSHIIYGNLAAICLMQSRHTEGIALLQKAIDLNPTYPEAHINLGLALKQQGNLTAAIASYNTAIQLKPNHADAHWNLAITMLLSGDYKNGWEEYEWRIKREKSTSKLHTIPNCDQWNGNIDLDQTSQLLLVSEQGLGDTLQFIRYANTLKKKGVSVSICAPQKLHSIIQKSGIDSSPLTPRQAKQVTKGEWVPLLSLPRHLKVSPINPIITEPYIETTHELTAKWANILEKKEKAIIGINWKGNPKTEKSTLKGRSLELENFAPITRCSQISLLSLQKGAGSEELNTCSFNDRFVSCQNQVNDTWDFLETAAIIANCDLVITSDTSVAHLAGGMGKTTWLLLHKVPDWRWGIEGDTTFWYPSMRLFRQKKRGDWNEVMERIAEAIQKNFGDSSIPPEPAPTSLPAIMSKPIQDIVVPISLGELIDKITILQIKSQHLQGIALQNVNKELNTLETTLNNLQLNIDTKLIQRLKEVNQDLWQIEDDIRDQERQKSFGDTFIRLARSVYQQNDRRSAIKKEINTTYDSDFVEEKSYKQY